MSLHEVGCFIVYFLTGLGVLAGIGVVVLIFGALSVTLEKKLPTLPAWVGYTIFGLFMVGWVFAIGSAVAKKLGWC